MPVTMGMWPQQSLLTLARFLPQCQYPNTGFNARSFWGNKLGEFLGFSAVTATPHWSLFRLPQEQTTRITPRISLPRPESGAFERIFNESAP